MARSLTVLDHVRVASPCPEPWAGMTGDERVRHCARCDLNVFNLSEMSRSEAEALILSRQGRLCVGYYQRPDGTILTRDCPVGLMLVRQKLSRVLGGIAALFAFVAAGLQTLARGEGERGRQTLRLCSFQPFEWIISWIAPPRIAWVEGLVSYTPPIPAAPSNAGPESSQNRIEPADGSVAVEDTSGDW